jgi:hypothetical protein
MIRVRDTGFSVQSPGGSDGTGVPTSPFHEAISSPFLKATPLSTYSREKINASTF